MHDDAPLNCVSPCLEGAPIPGGHGGAGGLSGVSGMLSTSTSQKVCLCTAGAHVVVHLVS